jgi:hypothetical protein
MASGAAVLASAAVLAVPAMASARIVINDSIAGVHLKMTRAQVRKLLGAPKRISAVASAQGTDKLWTYRKLHVLFGTDHKVLSVDTTRANQWTAARIHVGSTKAQVKAAYPSVRFTGGSGGGLIGAAQNGDPGTSFVITKKKVVQIAVFIEDE